MKNSIVFFLFIIMMVLSGCAKKGDVRIDVDAINGLANEYTRAIGTGDLEAVVSLMTNDVVMMPPNEPTRTGKDAIRSWYKSGLDRFHYKDVTYPTDEIKVFGDWALKRGNFKATLKPKNNGDPIQINIKAIHILKRQTDDSWKISHAIWNNNPPSE